MRAEIPEPLRKKLLPRRSLAGSAHPRSAAQVGKWLASTYPKKRESYWKRTNAQIFEAGLASTKDTSLLVPRKAAHALLSRLDDAGLRAADLDTLAVAERMAWHLDPEESLTPAIVAARGLADAVETAFRACSLGTDHDGGYTDAVLIVRAQDGPHGWRGPPGARLRHLVCAAADDAYAEARARAAALREDAGLRARAYLACAFPDERWADEDLRGALDPAMKDAFSRHLLGAASDPALARRWGEERSALDLAAHALDLASQLDSSDAIPLFSAMIPGLLARPAYGPVLKTPPRALAEAIGCYDAPEAAAALAPYASHAILGPLVLAWFADHPRHGAALERAAQGRDKLAEAASRVLGKRVESSPDAPIAETAAIPAVLRELPWRAKRGARKREPIVVADLPFEGLELERVSLLRAPRGLPRGAQVRDMTAAEVARWKEESQGDANAVADFEPPSRSPSQAYLRIPEREGLWAWSKKSGFLAAGPLAWVQRHGLATLDGFTSRERDWIGWLAWEGNDEYFDAACSLISPRIAPTIAAVAERRKRFRRAANGWLLAHAEVAALGLVRDAVSPVRETRATAEAALLFLARHGHGEALRAAARRYRAEVARALDALLTRDPLALGVAPPKRPPFLRVGDLPAPTLKSGGALDAEALSALVEMLQITPPDAPYPGLDVVRAACDAGSLGRLALELLEQWVIGDAPGRHEWMLMAVVHLRSDAGTRRLGELAREWSRKSLAKAERACAALAAEGSDLALMHLGHIADTTRFAALKKTAGELLREAAAARELSEDELGDHTVPDLGLGADGTWTLTYGARTFVVTPDPALRMVVRERIGGALGAATTTLPRPTKSDDPAAAKKAREAFDALRDDLDAVGRRQARRLEQALLKGRAWGVADFTRLARHPLLQHFARALVWELVPEQDAPRTFRVAEDHSYADASDAPLVLPAGARVRLAHPARTSDLAATWSAVFGDYELVQPFEQLGRAIHRPSPAESSGSSLLRAAGVTVPARKLLGVMESRGWERDDAGSIGAWLRSVAVHGGGAARARWPLTPPIAIDETFAHAPDVTMEALVIEDTAGDALPLGALDPVAFSELVRDVEAVRAL